MHVMQVGTVAALPAFGSQTSAFHGELKTSIFSPAPTKLSSARLVIRSVYPSDPFPPRVPRQGQPNEFKQPQEEYYTPPPPPVPYYGVPVKTPPPPARTLEPNKLPRKETNAEPPPPVPEKTGLSALGIPELELPEPANGEKPKSTYRSPYSKPEPPPRPYEPARPSNPKVIEWLNPPPPPTELMQREQFKLSETCMMTIYFGDITKWRVDGVTDAIVAPANKKVNAGAAVDGVIHKVAGHRLLSACQRLPEVGPHGVKCEVGSAVSTKAFNIPVSRIVHAVGPVYEGRESDPELEKTYISALSLASKEGIKHIVFPPLSCRIYGYPYNEGAEVALKALKNNCEGFTQIDIVVRNIEGYEAFVEEANKTLEVVKERRTVPAPPQPEQQGFPQGFPQQGFPQQGFPPQGFQQQGFPQQAYSQQPVPQPYL